MHQLFKFFIFLFTFTAVSTFGACPITHVALAEKLFKIRPGYSEDDKKAFIIGTVFPNIRYLADCDRSLTHLENVSLDDVLNASSPFLAGFLFHSYVDKQRELFVVSKGIYEYIASLCSCRPSMLIKLVEDELIFDSIDSNFCKKCLKTVLKEEKDFGIDEEVVENWHYLLTNYFSYKPGTILQYLSWRKLSFMGIPADKTGEMLSHQKQLIKDPFMHDYVDEMLEYFDSLIKTKCGSPFSLEIDHIL